MGYGHIAYVNTLGFSAIGRTNGASIIPIARATGLDPQIFIVKISRGQDLYPWGVNFLSNH